MLTQRPGQLGELVERRFLATGDEGDEDLAGCRTDDPRRVHGPPWNEHEASRAARHDLFAEEELELAAEDVEDLVAVVVDVTGRAEPRHRRGLEEPDRAVRGLAGRLDGQPLRTRDAVALSGTEHDRPAVFQTRHDSSNPAAAPCPGTETFPCGRSMEP